MYSVRCSSAPALSFGSGSGAGWLRCGWLCWRRSRMVGGWPLAREWFRIPAAPGRCRSLPPDGSRPQAPDGMLLEVAGGQVNVQPAVHALGQHYGVRAVGQELLDVGGLDARRMPGPRFSPVPGPAAAGVELEVLAHAQPAAHATESGLARRPARTPRYKPEVLGWRGSWGLRSRHAHQRGADRHRWGVDRVVAAAAGRG